MDFTSTPQLSSDDKLSIVFSTQLGVPKAKISRLHRCHRSTVKRIAKLYAEDPDNFLERKKYDTSNRFKLCEEDKARVLEYASNKSDATLKTIVKELELSVSTYTISRFLKANNVKLCPPTKRTKKKSEEPEMPAIEQPAPQENRVYESSNEWSGFN